MSFIRSRQRIMTAMSPHQANADYLVPKRAIPDKNFQTQVFLDNFEGASALLSGHAPDVGVAWAQWQGVNEMKVASTLTDAQSNGFGAAGPFFFSNQIVLASPLPDDFEMRWQFSSDLAALGSIYGVFYRTFDSNNWWRANFSVANGGQFLIEKTEAAVYQRWALNVPASFDLTADNFFMLKVWGNNHELSVNNRVVLSIQDEFNPGNVAGLQATDNQSNQLFNQFEVRTK